MNGKLRVSIVMSTYNGEKYVEEQLESILLQTLPPNQVIICDDSSTDETYKIVQTFIKKNNLTQWIVSKNSINQGWQKNFMQGFHKATGDVIFCADQDDIWDKEKIERMINVLEEDLNIKVLACNLEPFYEDVGMDKALTSYHLSNYGEKRVEKVKFDKCWLEPRRPGCAICFRKEIIPFVYKLWFEECAHDLAIWVYGVTTGSLYILNEKLVHYRRHSSISTPSNRKNRVTRSGLMRLYHKLSIHILENLDEMGCGGGETEKEIIKMDLFYQKREKAISTGNIFELLLLFLQINLYPKCISWIADIISSFCK